MVKDAMRCTRCRRALPLEKVERSSARSGRRRPHWWKAGNAGARMAQDVKAAGVREGTCVLAGDELRSLGLAADAIEVGKNTSDASHAASLLGAAFGTSRSDDRRFQPESFPMCPSAWKPTIGQRVQAYATRLRTHGTLGASWGKRMEGDMRGSLPLHQ